MILGGKDRRMWELNKRGCFFTKSFFGGLDHVTNVSSYYKGIWTCGIPSKVNFFIWISVLDKILTLNHVKSHGTWLVDVYCAVWDWLITFFVSVGMEDLGVLSLSSPGFLGFSTVF